MPSGYSVCIRNASGIVNTYYLKWGKKIFAYLYLVYPFNVSLKQVLPVNIFLQKKWVCFDCMQFSLKFKHTRLFDLVKKMIGLKWQISEKNKNYNLDLENLSDGDFNSSHFLKRILYHIRYFRNLTKY